MCTLLEARGISTLLKCKILYTVLISYCTLTVAEKTLTRTMKVEQGQVAFITGAASGIGTINQVVLIRPLYSLHDLVAENVVA